MDVLSMDKLIEAVMVMTEACDRFKRACHAVNAEPEDATGDQGRMYRAGRLLIDAALDSRGSGEQE